MTRRGREGRVERIGDLLGPALERMGPRTLWTEAKVRRCWAAVVGEEIAAHAHVRRLRNTTLVVDVSSDAWATELSYLSRTLIEKLNARMGEACVSEIVVQKARSRSGEDRR